MKIIITKSQYLFLINEQQQLQQLQQLSQQSNNKPNSDYLGKGGQFERSNPINTIIFKGKKTTIDDIMEEFRNAMSSTPGMLLQALFAGSTYAAPAVSVAYGALLVYDLYQWNLNKPNFWNILFDTLGLLTAGVLGPKLSSILNSERPVANSIIQVINVIKTRREFQWLGPYLKQLINFIPKISDFVIESLAYLIDKLGFTMFTALRNSILTLSKKFVNLYLDNEVQNDIRII
jgi:hypothetical protein